LVRGTFRKSPLPSLEGPGVGDQNLKKSLVIRRGNMPDIEISYDELWKDAVEKLFPHFIKLIAPDFYPDVDWAKPIIFLDDELRQISPDSEETKRYVDRLVRVWMLDGEEKWVLIHIEIQGYRDLEFSKRMFIYFYRIYDKFKKDILSLAVFADSSKRYKPDRFSYKFYGCELSFRYRTYKVIKQDDEGLKKSDNPFALVVLAAKKSLESRRDEEKRFKFKRELVILMLEKGYSRDEILAVFRFLDGVLVLTDLEKEKIIYNDLRSKEVEKVPYITNFERLAIEKGLKQGEQIGMLREARESVLDTLEEKFSMIPEEIQGRLQKIEEREVLRQLRRQAIRASSLEEFLKLMQR
jgi:hypothetical protein